MRVEVRVDGVEAKLKPREFAGSVICTVHRHGYKFARP